VRETSGDQREEGHLERSEIEEGHLEKRGVVREKRSSEIEEGQ
jgi:hypothetical protein